MRLTFPVIFEGNPPVRLYRDPSGRLYLQVPGATQSGWHSLLRVTPATGMLEVGPVTMGVDIDGTP